MELASKNRVNVRSKNLAYKRPFFQAKLSINQPNDIYEQEADATAERVMRMNDPLQQKHFFSPLIIQRKCAQCEEEEELKRKESSNEEASVPVETENYLGSIAGGKSLSNEHRNFFESRMGYDFSGVRIHNNSSANQSAKDINALAYTHGNNIVFGAGRFQPDTDEGKKLLAHELTHVVQQDQGIKTKSIQKQTATATDAQEELRHRVLEPLERNDAMAFLSRLRNLSQADASQLAADDVFFERIHRTFHGNAYWSVFNILYFNNRTRDPFLRLNLAMFQSDAVLAADTLNLLVNRPEFTQLYRNRLLTAVNEIFRGNARLQQIVQIINNPSAAGRTREVNHFYQEAHYETNTAGSGVITVFGLNMALTFYNTGSELRVIVKLRLVDGTDSRRQFYFLGANAPILETWLSAIRDRWNNKFSLNNGSNTLQLVFVPMILNEDPTAKEIKILTDESQHCTGALQRGGANCWYTTWPGNRVAHEFGHLIGASDEYALPATAAEIRAASPGMAQEDIDLSNYQSITGESRSVNTSGYTIGGNLMSDESNRVYARHVTRLVNIFNSGLPAGTARYRVITR